MQAVPVVLQMQQPPKRQANEGLCIALEPWAAYRAGTAKAFHVLGRAGVNFVCYRSVVRGHSNIWLA